MSLVMPSYNGDYWPVYAQSIQDQLQMQENKQV